jgi:hypothetical protein
MLVSWVGVRSGDWGIKGLGIKGTSGYSDTSRFSGVFEAILNFKL